MNEIYFRMKFKLVSSIFICVICVFSLNIANADTGCNLLETQNRRTQVANIIEPNSYIVHISTSRNYKHKSNKVYKGTAFFIHPRVLITAGHNVHKYKLWGITLSEVIEMRLKFGATNESTNLHETTIDTVQNENIYTNRNFKGEGDVSKDYGIIILADDTAYKKVGGSFKLRVFDTTVLADKAINIAGYPGNKPESTQWQDSTRNHFRYRDYYKYDFATSKGSSGSPVWYEENGSFNVFAIHTQGPKVYSAESCSSATLITKQVFDDIRNFCLKNGIDITK